MVGVDNGEKVGGGGKREDSLFVWCAEESHTVLQHSPSRGGQAYGKTADEESRKSIQAQEIQDRRSLSGPDGRYFIGEGLPEEGRSRDGPFLENGSR